MVPVFFGLMGFAVDLGHLYLVRHELKTAANAMALAAAGKLIGTETATDAATVHARLTLEPGSGFGNKYNFGALTIGETTGILASEAPDPSYYAATVDALGGEGATGSEVSGSTAKHVRVRLNAEAPLLFWSFLPLAAERKTPIEVQAVAGMSAPLCQACGIEPFAVAARDAGDALEFGFIPDQRYTFAYACEGQQGGNQVRYVLLNRYDTGSQAFPGEDQQMFRIGAGGLPGTTNTLLSCVRVQSADGENVWENAMPRDCTENAPAMLSNVMCGLYARFDAALPAACANIGNAEALSTILAVDSDLEDRTEYASYTGNGRRILTVPVVESIISGGGMVVLGFRQFLLEPGINPANQQASFTAIYLGSKAPLKQGAIGGCTQTAGPGKVVLHQ
jgi:hypothetical protein